ncbi:uncharacterized protein LOC131929544 [Physella acuta]|uniref:uncharacterized protein LOC131929544 n=1 Tax=Physella acuta TaxID=109671 RepID=UPI0027DD5D6A|nr:uncharacterized protein LOC131929544 [Physella acuta]XP_059141784.1 uncharacterized protein LOC131929544 [Physella acuta]XP_059141787.1 uncharacterized protein LOC131929544 [Physella acuta]XP_059141788.1 uncharacterized protein LOC131929544 [Physella acuta]XP_059141789.1 uncharacterized protein LOC131929544 [Physella acuta]XP_059141790.1 uncharacterized protein LOC131929544 [Physella acuta]XP_059141791.1 uncharacterized protein LOC131929544 [Physella acuta]
MALKKMKESTSSIGDIQRLDLDSSGCCNFPCNTNTTVSPEQLPLCSTALKIAMLPDIVLGKIISFLHWKEREWFTAAIPRVQHIMNSPLAWERFENDRCYAVEKLHIYFPVLVEQELNIIRKYGKYFQSCTIWIHKIFETGDETDRDCHLLEAVSQNCHNLKALCLMHPPDISVSKLKSSLKNYLQPLQCLTTTCGCNLKLSLNRMFYSSIDTLRSGILSFLIYLCENKLLEHIVCLDFSHGLVLDCSSNQSVDELLQCVNLQTLKCPIQSLNTAILINLTKKKLINLYLVNDDHTQESGFMEKHSLDWKAVQKALPEIKLAIFKVHYIFKNRAMCHEDMNPNPFLQSLIFDNLSSSISAKLLNCIADFYGATLQNLAFCSNYWEFLMHFTDLGKINESFRYLGCNCIQLESFLSCLSLPSSALVHLVKNSRKLTTVRVYKENIRLSTADMPEWLFIFKMGAELNNQNWDMIKKGENIFKIPNVDCRLLFANCFNEF